jgi:hypothetical protein
MLVRTPLMETEQNGSICIHDLTKIVMARARLWLAEERLVPFEAPGNVADTNDSPCAFHDISAVDQRDRDKPRRALLARSNITHRTSNISFFGFIDRLDGFWLQYFPK